jgi:hypothetical protein
VGVAFSRFLEVTTLHGLYIGMGVVFVYAVLGGMKGITYTQVAQYCVLITRLHHPGDLHLAAADRQPDPAAGPVRTMADVGNRAAAAAGHARPGLLTDLGFNEYTATTNPLNMVLYTLSLMIGTAGLPHVIIRFFTVPKVADARWSAGWALVFIALLYLTAPGGGCDGAPEHHHHHVARRHAGRSRAYDERPTGSEPGRSPAFWVRGQERRRPHPVLQRCVAGPGIRGRGWATSLSPSTVTSSCWPTRRSRSFRAG